MVCSGIFQFSNCLRLGWKEPLSRGQTVRPKDRCAIEILLIWTSAHGHATIYARSSDAQPSRNSKCVNCFLRNQTVAAFSSKFTMRSRPQAMPICQTRRPWIDIGRLCCPPIGSLSRPCRPNSRLEAPKISSAIILRRLAFGHHFMRSSLLAVLV